MKFPVGAAMKQTRSDGEFIPLRRNETNRKQTGKKTKVQGKGQQDAHMLLISTDSALIVVCSIVIFKYLIYKHS